eukprot:s1579_g18.t1
MFQPTSLEVMGCEWPIVGSANIPSEKYDVLVVLPKNKNITLHEDDDPQWADVEEWSPLEEEDDPRFSYLLRWLHCYLMKDEGLKPEVLGVHEHRDMVFFGVMDVLRVPGPVWTYQVHVWDVPNYREYHVLLRLKWGGEEA